MPEVFLQRPNGTPQAHKAPPGGKTMRLYLTQSFYHTDKTIAISLYIYSAL